MGDVSRRPPPADARAGHAHGAASDEAAVGRLVAGYRAAGTMLPGPTPCHPGLAVEAVGFQRWHDALLGVVISPCWMRLVRVADDAADLVEGSTRDHDLPQGRFPFTASRVHGDLAVEHCTLLPAMRDLVDQAAAVAVAKEAMAMVLAVGRARRSTSPKGDHGVE